MALVPTLPDDVTMMSPKEYWERDPRAVHFGKTEGDVEKERKLVQRIKELGLLENKIYIERQLMKKLETLMVKRDPLYSVLNKFRRKRPLRDRLNQTLSEIRRLIEPSIVRDPNGQKLYYNVNVLMGYFTRNVRYQVDKGSNVVRIYGETPGDEEKLNKEVVLEFPSDVIMAQVKAIYCAGVFKVSVPFGSSRTQNTDEQSMLGSVETESLPSVDGQSMTSADGQSMTSFDDVQEGIPSPEEDENRIIWV
ncbi:hypothetical protein LSH36_473g03028 [Paralvinella palmiformis]|uniref:Uncharacterized protein n=1 Tax=Paralvinella palmiformis TaxID=53620 RepID=A0AAD9MX25_9ANNE|nr:hypothetical protein LSH36_473g03028 [Paralvinella palmiformis]